MKAYQAQDPIGIEGLKRVDLPKPEAGPGEVLVRMRAATLNYRDLVIIKRGYASRQMFPLIPVSDGAGDVEEVGEGVTAFKPGDRVIGSFFPQWPAGRATEARLWPTLGGTLEGVLSEYRIFPEHALVATPEHLSDAGAAALPCAGLTAWSAIFDSGQVQPGDTVLTQGSGGVSLFALQFAKLAGAHIISTSSSDAKLARLTALGADETINYRTTPEWGKQARAYTGGRGVDVVVEVGGVGTLDESIRALAIGGTIAFIGVLAGAPDKPPRLPLMVMQQQRLQGVTVGSTDGLKAMARAISIHKIEPVIDQIFPFDQAIDAFRHLESGAHFGKVAIAID